MVPREVTWSDEAESFGTKVPLPRASLVWPARWQRGWSAGLLPLVRYSQKGAGRQQIARRLALTGECHGARTVYIL